MSARLPPPAPRHAPGGVRELLAIALPMVASQACETAMMFTDRLFLAKLGPEYMSAAMGGGVACFLFMTFFLGLAGYATALVAQNLGAGRKEQCGLAAAQAVWISLAAFPLILLARPVGHWLFDIGGVAPAQRGPQIQYFDIVLFGTVTGLVRNALACFFSGIGRTRVTLVSAAVALAVNAGANYVLIFGKLGFPALGIAGAAYGTILGSVAGLAVLSYRYFGRECRTEYHTLCGLRFDWPLMKTLVRFGTPSGAEFFLNLLAFNVLVLTFHSFGVATAAAMTITLNWDMMSFIPLCGIGVAVTSLVGRYMGAQDPDTAARATRSGMTVAFLYTCVTFTAFCVFPRTMAGVFLPPPGSAERLAIEPIAVFMLRFVVVYLFADAVGIVFAGALRGAGDTFWTMVITVGGHWVFASGAMITAKVFHGTPQATWVTTNLLFLGVSISLYLRYRSGRWRSLKPLDAPPPPQPVEEAEIPL